MSEENIEAFREWVARAEALRADHPEDYFRLAFVSLTRQDRRIIEKRFPDMKAKRLRFQRIQREMERGAA